MRRRYKVVLNIDITDPDKSYPAGGDYTHLNRIDGTVKALTAHFWTKDIVITLDKIIDKGEIQEKQE